MDSKESMMKALAIAAKEALELLHKIQSELRQDIAVHKGKGDIATAADLATEEFLVEKLNALFPGIPVLAEEGGLCGEVKDQVFIIDPLDGTTNFHHGQTHFAVALALVEQGVPVVSAAAVGEVKDIYSAARGGGAFLNGARIRTEPVELTHLSLVAVPSAFDGPLPAYISWLYLNGGKIRNNGSAVSHICQIASQRMDLCVLNRAKLWDFVSPGLILLEAGGFLSDFRGKPLFPLDKIDTASSGASHALVASNGKAHVRLLGEGVLGT